MTKNEGPDLEGEIEYLNNLLEVRAAEISALEDQIEHMQEVARKNCRHVTNVDAEIAALKAIVASYIVYDDGDHDDSVKMMLDYAEMLAASRAAISLR